jgi:phage terminase small subunit
MIMTEKNPTPKQRAFIEAYLTCWNASEAARQAGYTGKANVIGPRLLANVSIKAAIKQRLDEKALAANEVLAIISDQARGDMGEFLDISSVAFQVNLARAKEKGLTKLIKKVKQRTTTTLSKEGIETETSDIEIELYDAQSAAVHMGRHHALFTDNHDVTSAGQPITMIEVIKDYGTGQTDER